MQAAFDMTVEWAFDRYSLRPAAGLVPGAQAPVRRHEDLAGGQPRASATPRPGRGQRRPPTPGSSSSTAKAFIGDYGSELLQDCVQMHGGHRGDLRARPPPVPPSPHGRPGSLRHPGRPPPAALCHRREPGGPGVTTPDVRGRRILPGPGPDLRPRQPPAGRHHQMVGALRNERTDDEELTAVARDREVQRMLFDGGLAGICFPKEYGGPGPHPAHQRRPQRGVGRVRVPVPRSRPRPSRRAPPSCSSSGPRSRSTGTFRPSSRARRSGCSSCPSRAVGRTSPAR